MNNKIEINKYIELHKAGIEKIINYFKRAYPSLSVLKGYGVDLVLSNGNTTHKINVEIKPGWVVYDFSYKYITLSKSYLTKVNTVDIFCVVNQPLTRAIILSTKQLLDGTVSDSCIFVPVILSNFVDLV